MPCCVEFAHLALAGLVWFLLHAAVAGSQLRGWLVARFGERAYLAGFSLTSLASLWWLIHAYRAAPYRALWSTPAPLHLVPLVVVPLALVLLVGAFTVKSPTAVGGEKFLDKGEPVRGVLRITRHPFLWSVVAWSVAHLVVSPDLGSQLFFTSLGLTALSGSFDIDRKRRRSNPEAFARFEAVSSNLPFAALRAGRTRLVWRELWLPLLLGLALASGAALLHPYLFGTRVLPALPG
jgi:uncharacterized membrane protein